jgi:hypothetical protein
MTDRPSPVAPPERYVDARELAAVMGVSPTTVKRWVAAGCPSETWGMARTRRFLPSQVIAWAGARSKIPSSRDRAHNAPGTDNRRE